MCGHTPRNNTLALHSAFCFSKTCSTLPYCNSLFVLFCLKVIYVARNPKDAMVSSFHFHKMAVFLDDPGTFQEFMDKFLKGQGQRLHNLDSSGSRLCVILAKIFEYLLFEKIKTCFSAQYFSGLKPPIQITDHNCVHDEPGTMLHKRLCTDSDALSRCAGVLYRRKES